MSALTLVPWTQLLLAADATVACAALLIAALALAPPSVRDRVSWDT